MDATNLSLNIIPKDVEIKDLSAETLKMIGSVPSNMSEIKVNKVTDGYSIIYDEDTFLTLAHPALIINIINLFRVNLPGKSINMQIFYDYDLDDIEEDEEDVFDVVVGAAIVTFDHYIKTLPNNVTLAGKPGGFNYQTSGSVINSAKLIELYAPDDDDEDDDYYSEEIDEDYDENDPLSVLNAALGGYKSSKEKSYCKKGGKSKNKQYGSSRVLKASKNAKKLYHRHGVLIVKDKDPIKKDEKIINEFLKDFIPGNAEWKRDLRHDLRKRWMQVYAITNKQLKELEKKHRKAQAAKKRSSIDTDKALDFTRRLFNVPIDSWSDPNK